jgi:hypothetical protein
MVHPTGQYSKRCPQVEGQVLRSSARYAKLRRSGIGRVAPSELIAVPPIAERSRVGLCACRKQALGPASPMFAPPQMPTFLSSAAARAPAGATSRPPVPKW